MKGTANAKAKTRTTPAAKVRKESARHNGVRTGANRSGARSVKATKPRARRASATTTGSKRASVGARPRPTPVISKTQGPIYNSRPVRHGKLIAPKRPPFYMNEEVQIGALIVAFVVACVVVTILRARG